MHFITITSAALATLAATAIAAPTKSSDSDVRNPPGFAPLPKDLPPGIHEYKVDADGNVNITKIAELDPTPRTGDSNPHQLRQSTTDTYQSCSSYSLTSEEAMAVPQAWASLTNWASGPGGYSPWVSSYVAYTSAGAAAYMCQWGNGNHISPTEINMAKGSIAAYCTGGAGMLQWNTVRIL